MARTELEKSLATFTQANGFTRIQVAFFILDDGREFFSASTFWPDENGTNGVSCEIAFGESIVEALTKARAQSGARRIATIADEAIPMGEAA